MAIIVGLPSFSCVVHAAKAGFAQGLTLWDWLIYAKLAAKTDYFLATRFALRTSPNYAVFCTWPVPTPPDTN